MKYTKPEISSVNSVKETIRGRQAGSKTGLYADAWTPFYPNYHLTVAAHEPDE